MFILHLFGKKHLVISPNFLYTCKWKNIYSFSNKWGYISNSNICCLDHELWVLLCRLFFFFNSEHHLGYTELSLYLSMMAPSVNTDHYFSSNWSVKINLIMHEKAQAVLSIHFEFELTSIFPLYYFCQRWAVDFEIDKRTTWEKFLRFELRRIVAKLAKWR